jgi:5-methylcytosine-specific restriction endonuclease McrA
MSLFKLPRSVTRALPPLRLGSFRAVLLRDPCVYCGRQPDTLDHILPRARGGRADGFENRAPACRRCNQRKGAIPLLLFLVHIRRHRWSRFASVGGR